MGLRSGKKLPEWEAGDYGRAARERDSRRAARKRAEKSGEDGNERPSARAKKAVTAESPEDSKKILAPKIPVQAERPLTRRSAVFCTHFGVNRKEQYPDHFFCHGCDMAESVNAPDINVTRTLRHKCAAGHRSFIHPTTLRQKTCVFTINPDSDYGNGRTTQMQRRRRRRGRN